MILDDKVVTPEQIAFPKVVTTNNSGPEANSPLVTDKVTPAVAVTPSNSGLEDVINLTHSDSVSVVNIGSVGSKRKMSTSRKRPVTAVVRKEEKGERAVQAIFEEKERGVS
ncbi:hypothetical protein EB796_021230 [Bugula neritina]|uniref:Uncharacterized protein n=1 Tax=Bugula neritina TaxID=10212 RepID=A0A7J7J473_BUGNE|nr:hypothetical protein EB796_021230 [Bugula neritina]